MFCKIIQIKVKSCKTSNARKSNPTKENGS